MDRITETVKSRVNNNEVQKDKHSRINSPEMLDRIKKLGYQYGAVDMKEMSWDDGNKGYKLYFDSTKQMKQAAKWFVDDKDFSVITYLDNTMIVK